MDYKEKYEMALEGIQEILGSGEDSVKMSRLQLRLQGIFPELKESEDEKWIPKEIAKYLKEKGDFRSCWLAWLEKQGEHAKFRDSIQVGDKVTRNQDGVLVNLSQLNRVAKKDEKQGDDKVEQKPWSEEDAKTLNRISAILVDASEVKNWWKESRLIEREEMVRLTDFLKSLKDRYAWKPSLAQLNALSIVSKGIAPDDIEAIISLYNDLKKLRNL